MATKIITAFSPASKKAVEHILNQQKQGKFWDGKAHAAALGTLAFSFISDKEKQDKTGESGKKGLVQELNVEPWLYASNMKKRLEELNMIPSQAVDTGDYQ
jgi:hypothetical protein